MMRYECRGRTRGAPVASGGWSGQGVGCAPTQHTKGHKGRGDPGLRSVVSERVQRRLADTIDRAERRWVVARPAFPWMFSIFPKGDAHVESQPARIVCLLPCRFVRQE